MVSDQTFEYITRTDREHQPTPKTSRNTNGCDHDDHDPGIAGSRSPIRPRI
jgi:hypothetical protein